MRSLKLYKTPAARIKMSQEREMELAVEDDIKWRRKMVCHTDYTETAWKTAHSMNKGYQKFGEHSEKLKMFECVQQ
uniref:Uncharacterized protein n=1 Tax=Steinernema glaseri TaxID=37863 RepID=A0A1I8AG43_9BILA